MRNSSRAIRLFIALLFAAQLGHTQQPPLKTASLESHEGLTVSVLPWTDGAKYKPTFPKKSPYAAGVVALEVSFRNDSPDSMSVNLKRIRLTLHLDENNTQELPSLSSEEVADVVFKPNGKDPTSKRRLPLPVGIPKASRSKNWEEFQTQVQNAAVPTKVIAPHSSVLGLLYFDLQKQYDLLETSHLYIPEIVVMQGNRALTYFDIDLGQQRTP